MAHGDYCDCDKDNVLRTLDFTNDASKLTSFADDAPRTNGGDAPEVCNILMHGV